MTTEPPLVGPEISSVSDDDVVIHRGPEVSRYEELEPDRDYELDGVEVRTLPRMGELLCRFATVNDVHFGETEAGVLDDVDDIVVCRSEPGEQPYPEIMNRGAVTEISAIGPAAVIAKGDLTTCGTIYEWQAFLDHYERPFGERLHYVRGNHDAYRGESHGDTGPVAIELPGVTLAVIDTVIPRKTTGQVRSETLEWLDALSAEADRPVLVFGHHQTWMPGGNRSPHYFGINPDDSEALIAMIARRPTLRGYFAGHTHRNRVRHAEATGDVPFVEVACVKDYPGSWAEYRVFDGGILQVHRRISQPDALAWSEKTRVLYQPLLDYVEYALGRLEDRCFPIPAIQPSAG